MKGELSDSTSFLSCRCGRDGMVMMMMMPIRNPGWIVSVSNVNCPLENLVINSVWPENIYNSHTGEYVYRDHG